MSTIETARQLSAAKIFKKSLSPNHLDTLKTTFNLARIAPSSHRPTNSLILKTLELKSLLNLGATPDLPSPTTNNRITGAVLDKLHQSIIKPETTTPTLEASAQVITDRNELTREILASNIALYFRDIPKNKLLTHHQEIELAKTIEDGKEAADMETVESEFLPHKRKAQLDQIKDESQEARSTLAESNLRLVVSVALRYRDRGLSLGDLIGEGNEGLMLAIDKYDYKLGYKFSTYAVWWIRQRISEATMEQRQAIKIPRSAHERYQRFAREEEGPAIQKTERILEDNELAAVLHTTVDKIQSNRAASKIRVYSLDTPALHDNDDPYSLVHNLVDSDPYNNIPTHAENAYLVEFVHDILNSPNYGLTPREAWVLKMNFGIQGHQPTSLKDIGEILDLSKAGVSLNRVKALKKLRAHPRIKQEAAELIS